MPKRATTNERSLRQPLECATLCAYGRVVGVVSALLLSAACAHYEPRPISLQQNAQNYAARQLDGAETREAVRAWLPERAANWPPQKWNRADLLAIALAQNPQLAVARAEVQAALAKESSAAETPNPGLQLQSEYAHDEADRWLYGLAFDFVLRSPARKRLDIDIARLTTANARWQVVEQTWKVRQTLVAALNDGEAARRRSESLDRLIATQHELVSLQQRRIEAGEDAPSEIVVARASLLEIEQQRAQANVDASAAQSALAAVLGLPGEALAGIQIDWSDWGAPPESDKATFDAAREQALLTRADLASAIGDYASAEKQLERAVVRQYPEFHLNPGYYWDHGVAKWPFDVGFDVPLFNRNEGEIAEARAAREVAGQRMLAVQADIYAAIGAATRAQTLAAENLAAVQRRVEAADTQSRHAELGLKLGASDRSEWIGANAVALRAELDLLQMRAQYQAARNALEDALHTPLSGPELALRPALRTAVMATNTLSDNGGRP